MWVRRGEGVELGVLAGHSFSRSLCSARVAVSLCLTQPSAQLALGLIQCSLELQCGHPQWSVCPKVPGQPSAPWQASSAWLIANICWDDPCSCLKLQGGDLWVFHKKPLSFRIGLYTSLSCKRMQMLQGQTAPPLTRMRGNYSLLSLAYYRGWESVFPLPLCVPHTGFTGSRSRLICTRLLLCKTGNFLS